MKTQFLTKASRLIGRAGLQLKKHSPEILVVGGVIGGVVSTVMACKATTKAGEILEEKNKGLDAIKTCVEDESIEYSEETRQKDLTLVYTQTGVKLLKLYGPAITVGALSIASILTGHHILKKRNFALAAAYTMVDTSFKNYRKNTVERFGEVIDNELLHGIKAQELEEIIVDENGNEKIEKTIVETPNIGASPYAKFFDEACYDWTKDPNFNLMFLRKQQDYANDLLRTRGYVFLNEVYDMLGIPRIPDGQLMGWIYDEKNKDRANHIDFGIYDVTNERKRAFVNGYERNILLDFNIDGPIYNLI